MEKRKISNLNSALIWLGASISIAEIITGTLFAPMGLKNGIYAILLGHIIGCFLFYLAGLIGAKTKDSAMETVKRSYGKKGSVLFSSLNTLQLIGWTAVMIISGASSASVLVDTPYANTIFSIVIGLFILLWVITGITNSEKLNIVAMSGLLIVTFLLAKIIFFGNNSIADLSNNTLSFGIALELSIAMPLSWLPLISDYTSNAKDGNKSTLISTIVYFLGSSFMYIIGLSAAVITKETDIAKIMLQAGLGTAGLFIVIFSTVTTTFLDVYSAGISAKSIYDKIDSKIFAIITTISGVILALLTSTDKLELFLLFISSVFAPMVVIQIVDFFIFKKDYKKDDFNFLNLVLWFFGFILYRYFLKINTPIGNTLPVIFILFIVSVVIKKIMYSNKQK